MNPIALPSIDLHARRRYWALTVGILGFGACAGIAFADVAMVLRSYLFAWLFALSLSLGSMAALMMYHLTGGSWGVPVRRYFESAASLLPLLAVLFIPLAVGLTQVFDWSAASDSIAAEKSWYLNRVFFLIRAITFLVAWSALALLLERSARQQRRVAALSAIGLLIYGVTVTFAAVDWIGSLVPRWSSTALGLIVMTGQGLGAFAFAVAAAARMQLIVQRLDAPSRDVLEHAPVTLTEQRANDLGNLLLAFVMTWMYLVFAQFLIIWAEDLPRETVWYLMRSGGVWHGLTVTLVLAQFAIPFSLLLFRKVKRDPRMLLAVAGLALVAHWLDIAWLLLPSTGHGPQWTDLLATFAVGGVWLFGFWRHLVYRPSFAHAAFEQPADAKSVEAAHG